jgi:hypothetical protein
MTMLLKAKAEEFECEFENFYDLVIKTKTDFRLFSIEISHLEKELNTVLDIYYKLVNNIDGSSDITNSVKHDNDFLLSLKNLYRRINKLFDLELSFNIENINIHIEQLFKIEQYFSTSVGDLDHTPREILNKYSDKCDIIVERLKVMKNLEENSEITNSTIQRQFLWEKMCADELIEKIKSDIEKEMA